MQQTKSAETFFSDIQATMKKILSDAPTGYPFDIKAAMDAQRKNFQALTEANQLALQGWQVLAQRQTEMVSKFVQDNSTLARQTFVAGKPEDKIAAQAEIIKSCYERSINNSQELAEMALKCTNDAADVINQRILASLGEIKASSKKSD